MATDEELVVRVAAGDEPALAMLLQRYQGPLSRFLHRHTGGHDVDDLYQETWLRVVGHADRFDRERRFSTWLFQIAINLCRDWFRRRRPEGEGGSAEVLVADPPAETRLDAEKLLMLLPEPQREVLILRYFHDLGEDEIARIVNCPKGTVKSRLHNALARLTAVVRAEGL